MDSRSENEEKQLVECLDDKLKPYDFKKISLDPFLDPLMILAIWRLRSWNANRAVVAVSLPTLKSHPGKYAQMFKIPLGRILGYVPFFYPLRLEIILLGNPVGAQKKKKPDALEKFIDQNEQQGVILQSINVVDLTTMKSVSARAGNQKVIGRFQDAIEVGITTFLNNIQTV